MDLWVGKLLKIIEGKKNIRSWKFILK